MRFAGVPEVQPLCECFPLKVTGIWTRLRRGGEEHLGGSIILVLSISRILSELREAQALRNDRER